MNSLGRNNDNKQKKESIFGAETFGVILILFATLTLICLITRETVFSDIGQYVNTFFFGTFGYFAYPLVIALIVKGIMLVVDKKSKLTKKRRLLFILSSYLLAVLIHAITLRDFSSLPYGEYLQKSYLMAEGGFATCSGGGILTGLTAYVFSSLLTNVGTYVVVSILLALSVYALANDYYKLGTGSKKAPKPEEFRGSFVNTEDKDIESIPDFTENVRPYPIEDVSFGDSVSSQKQKLFVSNASDFAFKTKKEKAQDENNQGIKLFHESMGLNVVNTDANSYANKFGSEMEQKINYIKTPANINIEETLKKSYSTTSVSNPLPRNEEKVENTEETLSSTNIPMFNHTVETPDTATAHAEAFANKYLTPETDESVVGTELDQTFRPIQNEEVNTQTFRPDPEMIIDNSSIIDEPEIETKVEPEVEIQSSPIVKDRRARSILFGDTENEEKAEEKKEEPKTDGFISRVEKDDNSILGTRRTRRVPLEESLGEAEIKKEEKTEPVEKPKKVVPINRVYNRPPLDLLEMPVVAKDAPQENHEERKEIIKQTLESFHINAVPQGHVQGPSITRYEIKMPEGISVKKVLNYDNDLKMWLAVKDGVRIEAPIPGKNLVGIEVANTYKTPVGLREVMEEANQEKTKPGSLMFCIGKDLVGKAKSDNLAKGPHYLVAGATGAGKSVCLNVMLCSLIMRYSPEELRLILVDPKRVEFRNYEHLPHLMIDEIITDSQKVLAVLSWAYAEMERRYDTFANSGGLVVDIDAYNANVASDTVPKMPRIVIVIDELADLMQTCKKDLEARICALAQKARSAGIHLVLATQRPSVDVITGTIKANLSSRIAFRVMNYTDSQTILGEQGAEKLLGNGDMLYKNSTMPGYERYQGAYISTREVNNICNYIKENNEAYFDDELADYLDRATRPKQEEEHESSGDGDKVSAANDELFMKALSLAINSGSVSISQLQRRFQIGYNRAGGIVDRMERMGYISGYDGQKARSVLITREEFEAKYGISPEGY